MNEEGPKKACEDGERGNAWRQAGNDDDMCFMLVVIGIYYCFNMTLIAVSTLISTLVIFVSRRTHLNTMPVFVKKVNIPSPFIPLALVQDNLTLSVIEPNKPKWLIFETNIHFMYRMNHWINGLFFLLLASYPVVIM